MVTDHAEFSNIFIHVVGEIASIDRGWLPTTVYPFLSPITQVGEIASIDSILYTKCQGGDFLARDKGVLPAPQGAVLDWGTDSTFSGGTVSNVRSWRGAKVSA